jgi:hypothetical protein
MLAVYLLVYFICHEGTNLHECIRASSCLRGKKHMKENLTNIMEIGISMFGDLAFDNATRSFQSPQERLQDMLEEIKLADEVGLDVFGIGEHHRPDFAVSAPEIILAAAASVTKNIKLTSSVTVLSSTDPVRVYQNFATVDLISGGRAEITRFLDITWMTTTGCLPKSCNC